jgi:hypothetical protein
MSRSAITLSLVCATTLVLGACMSTPPTQTVHITQERLLGEWSLVRVGSQRVSDVMTLDFRDDGILLGSVRCNSMSGPYEVRSARIVFPDGVIITAAGCGKRTPSSQSAADTAERVLFRSPVTTFALSYDLQKLFVTGNSMLQFQRIR